MKEKQPEYAQGHDKVIFQHDIARPHVSKRVKKSIRKMLNGKSYSHPPAIFTRLGPFELSLISIDAARTFRITLTFLQTNENLA